MINVILQQIPQTFFTKINVKLHLKKKIG